jgi:hypothetical protein
MVGSRGYRPAVDMCHENGSELLEVTMLGGVAPPSRIQLTIKLRICLYHAVCNWNLGLPERLNTSGMTPLTRTGQILITAIHSTIL